MARDASDKPVKSRKLPKLVKKGGAPLEAHEERVLIELFAESSAQIGGSAERPLSVGEINAFLSQVLVDILPPQFYVRGEISNFRTYDRGHAFFTLKESGAELPCIMWKDQLARVKFKPKDGLAVVARGAVRLYEPQGKIQLYVESLNPEGAGALELAFRQLCEKLRAEGLFEPERKRALPRLPRRVVIITSRTGSVLHDVLTTAYRRYPGLHVMLFPVRVQGEQAAGDMIRAIEAMNAWTGPAEGPVDLILLVRGGGSLEDLWAFNEEGLARAIVASRIPIATGIGHEPDTTIADLVGDLRGPTPTGLAELTIPDVAALSAELRSAGAMMTRDIRRTVTSWQNALERMAVVLGSVMGEAARERRYRLDQLALTVAGIEPRHAIAQGWRRVEEATHRLERMSPGAAIPRLRERLEHLQVRLAAGARAGVATERQRLEAMGTHLQAVSPQGVLERGFSITTDAEGRIVRTTRDVQRGDVLKTRVADGTIVSTVGKPRQESLF